MKDLNYRFSGFYNFTLKANEAVAVDAYFIPFIIDRSGFTDYKVLEESFLSTHEGIVLVFGHPLNEAINDKISALLESGIMNRWIKQAYSTAKIGGDPEDGPQVLTLDHLFIGFAIWLVALTFTIVVFFIEVVNNYCKQRFEARRVIKPFVN